MKWSINRLARLGVVGLVYVFVVAELPGLLSTDAALAASAQQGSVQVQGRQGTFTVYIPDRFDRSRRYPIVMVLHGGRGDGSKIAEQSQMPSYVDNAGVIAVFPNAGEREWNDGRRTTQSGADDVNYLRAVVDAVANQWNGDPNRVLVAGASNGGMMTQRLACEASESFTAFGAAVAHMPADLVGRCNPSGPVPIVLFSGTDDRLMPWNGGEIASSRVFGGAGGQVISASDTFEFWARHNRCDGSTASDLPDRARDGTRVKVYAATNCRSGADVRLYVIHGGGHAWPGGPPPQRRIARRIIGNVTQDISASAILLDFFSQYAR